jgi:hypothetical protein
MADENAERNETNERPERSKFYEDEKFKHTNPTPPVTVTAAPKTSEALLSAIFTVFMFAASGVIFCVFKKRKII